MSILQDLLALRETPIILDENEELGAGEAKGFAEELEDFHKAIAEAMEGVRHVVRQLPRHMRGSAEAYFIPHIMIALGGEHEWMTAGHEVTLQKLIDELKEYEKEYNDDSTRSPDFHGTESDD